MFHIILKPLYEKNQYEFRQIPTVTFVEPTQYENTTQSFVLQKLNQTELNYVSILKHTSSQTLYV